MECDTCVKQTGKTAIYLYNRVVQSEPRPHDPVWDRSHITVCLHNHMYVCSYNQRCAGGIGDQHGGAAPPNLLQRLMWLTIGPEAKRVNRRIAVSPRKLEDA